MQKPDFMYDGFWNIFSCFDLLTFTAQVVAIGLPVGHI